MMYIHSHNETDKRINVSKIANNKSTMKPRGLTYWYEVIVYKFNS